MAEEKLEAKVGLDSSGFNKAIDDAKAKVDTFGKDGKKAINAIEAAANNINLSALKGAFGEVAGAISEDLKKPVTDIGELVGGIANAVMTGRWDQAISGGIKLIADAINKAKKEAEEYQKRLDEIEKQKQAAAAQSFKAEAQALTRLDALNNGNLQGANRQEAERLMSLLNGQGFSLSWGSNGRIQGIAGAYGRLEALQNAEANRPLEASIAKAHDDIIHMSEQIASLDDQIARWGEKVKQSVANGLDAREVAQQRAALNSLLERRAATDAEMSITMNQIEADRQALRSQKLEQSLTARAPGMLASEADARARARADAEEAARLARIEAWKNSPEGREADIMLKRNTALQEFNNLTNGGRLPRTALKAGDLKRADQLANDLRMYDKELLELASQTNWLGKIYNKLPPVQNQ